MDNNIKWIIPENNTTLNGITDNENLIIRIRREKYGYCALCAIKGEKWAISKLYSTLDEAKQYCNEWLKDKNKLKGFVNEQNT